MRTSRPGLAAFDVEGRYGAVGLIDVSSKYRDMFWVDTLGNCGLFTNLDSSSVSVRLDFKEYIRSTLLDTFRPTTETEARFMTDRFSVFVSSGRFCVDSGNVNIDAIGGVMKWWNEWVENTVLFPKTGPEFKAWVMLQLVRDGAKRFPRTNRKAAVKAMKG